MRLADKSDDGAIVEALVKLKRYAAEYNWAVGINFDKASASVFHEVDTGNAWVIDGYLVLVNTFKPWYSNECILQEWLTLKLYPNGNINSVPPALLQLAANKGASLALTADSSPVNIMAKAYSDAGFSPLTQSFYKRVP